MARTKRVFKRRTGEKKLFTFHSYGTHISFAPFDFTTDDRILNEVGEYESMTKLDFYRNEVRMSNESHVYILDHTGLELGVI